MDILPIDPEILRKRSMIPVLLAELSYVNREEAIRLLRIWGEKRKPITPLYDELISVLDNEPK